MLSEATLRLLADAEDAAAAIMRAGPTVAAEIGSKLAAILSALARHQHAATSRLMLPAPAEDGSRARLLTARELAGALALTPARVYELARTGRIPSKRIGERQLRFDVTEVRHALGR